MTQVGGACSITNICNPGSYTCIEGGVAGARSCVNDNECGRGGNMICSNSTCMDAGGTNTQRNMGGGDRDGADGDVTRGGVCAASTECAGTDVCDTDECGNIVNKPGCDCYDGTKYKAHWQCPSGDQLYLLRPRIMRSGLLKIGVNLSCTYRIVGRSRYANGGMTATDACCVCGGGSTPLIDAATCTASAAACVALDGCAHSKTQMMSIVIVVLVCSHLSQLCFDRAQCFGEVCLLCFRSPSMRAKMPPSGDCGDGRRCEIDVYLDKL